MNILTDEEIEAVREQRAALRKLAEEATPVAWSIFFADEPCEVYLNKDDAKTEYMRRNEVYPDKSRGFKELYQFNPSTILQLLDYIEALESESAAYASNLRGKHFVAGATYATMQARIETLEKDAGRYRHLRDRNGGSLVVVQIIGVGEDDQVVLTEGDADAAIDAAMQGKK